MYKTIGHWEPEYLLSDPQGAEVIAIPCAPGNGIIERGQIMKRGDDGMYVPAAAADITNANSLVIIDEAIDTTESATIAADARRLKLTGGTALTAAHKLVLRQQGMLLDHLMEDAPEFNNEKA